ncbi:hypothetical protein [Dendronalium sp. ChiSLP03b]|uniref:hypothetical protein n=1 Tax=Dendronalium sp. ChiSLP03b TaxID=3075381 RepID=UPI002AD560C7|nr:hypothetical protein [Dendronalium sp. ChiSLP03b]MDZ8208777.1 hypothetical protein [Dendronalium sp. ChiSLP03b]
MPYTKEALQNMYSLSPEDVLATLTACGLAHDTQEYSDTDIETRFDIVRQLFKDGQASDYQQATTLFQQRLDDNSSTDMVKNERKNHSKPTKPLDIAGLLSFARKQGFKLKLTEALKILAFCELGEKDEYTPGEVELFIVACHSISQEISDVSIEIEDMTTESEQELTGLVERVTDKFVEKIPPGLVKQVYAQKAIAKLAQQPDEGEDFLLQMERRIMERIEGKPSPMKSLLEKYQMKLLPHTPIKSMQLPSASENDTTTR